MNNITVLITTFLRENCCNTIVNKWISYNENISIIVIDSGEKYSSLNFTNHKNIRHLKIDFDTGLSEARNIGKKLIDTNYFFLSDDDNLPPSSQAIKNTMNIIKNSDIDIIGCSPRRYYIDNNTLFVSKPIKLQKQNTVKCDIVSNHFFAKNLPFLWDENIKFRYEHYDFFMSINPKYNTYGTNLYKINQLKFSYLNKKYNQYKSLKIMCPNQKKYFFDKWKINSINYYE